jgi:hypothetical protein
MNFLALLFGGNWPERELCTIVQDWVGRSHPNNINRFAFR